MVSEKQFLIEMAAALELKGNEKIAITDELRSFPTWDSIAHLRVTQLLEVNYKVLVSADTLTEFKKVADILKFVEKNRRTT